tara:strand:- start:2617 stop:3030 length:414 start_codon:yes stop_codon:yes gene_type:complete
MRRLLFLPLGITLLYICLMLAASEFGGEVAILMRPEQDGSVSTVRVWIVDADNKSWVEHGDSSSFWISQLNNPSEISLIRRGEEKRYIGVSDANAHDLYHQLRREKYGIADWIVEIGSFGSAAKDACNGVVVEFTQK